MGGAPPGALPGGKEQALPAYNYDLVIIGAGSGNMLPAEELTGWRVATGCSAGSTRCTSGPSPSGWRAA